MSLKQSDDKVRIKAILGEDIRVLNISRNNVLSPTDRQKPNVDKAEALHKLLSECFQQPVHVYQYEDTEQDRVTVGEYNTLDVDDLLAIYDFLTLQFRNNKSASGANPPTLKLFLKSISSSPSTILNTNASSIFTPPLREDHVINIHSTVNETSNKLPALRTPPPSPPRSRRNSVADVLPRDENSMEFSQSISPHVPNDHILKAMDPRLFQHLHNAHQSLHDEFGISNNNINNNNNSNLNTSINNSLNSNGGGMGVGVGVGRVSTPPLRTPPLSRSNSIDGLSGDGYNKVSTEGNGVVVVTSLIDQQEDESPVISDQFSMLPLTPPNLSYGLKNSTEIELALEEMRRINTKDPYEDPLLDPLLDESTKKRAPSSSFEDDYHSGSFKDKHLGPVLQSPFPILSNDHLDIVTDHPDLSDLPNSSNRSQPIGIPISDDHLLIHDNNNNHSPPLLIGTPMNNHILSSGTSPNSTNGGSFLINMNNNTTSQITWKKGQILGRGGFGNVYLGLNSVTGELFAVKQLELPPIENSKGNIEDQKSTYHKKIQSYQKEIEVMRKLNHPNIVRYLGTQFDFSDNCLYIFLEYVPGGSIHTLLSKFGPFSESVIKLYTKQILLGLEYLHSNGIIHRDIKGANILVDTRGNCKLADFGCAKVFANLQRDTNSVVKSVLGTPHFMAPEVIRGENYGKSCDIWSLGCTFIEMSSGRPPWSNEYSEITAVMFHIASSNDIPHLPSHLDFSPEAHDFILRCLKRNPSERPSAAVLLSHAFIKSLEFTFPPSMNPNNNNNNNNNSPPSNTSLLSSHQNGENQISLVKERPLSNYKNTTSSVTTITKLPTEILHHIFSFLEEQYFASISSVCKNWKLQMEDDMIWRYKTLLHWKKTKKPTELKWRSLYNQQREHDLHWFHSPFNSISFKGKTHAKSINTIIFCNRSSFVSNAAATTSNSSSSPILDGVNYLVTGSDDKKVKFWNINKAKMTKSLKGHTGSINSICLTDNTSKLLTGSSDKTIKMWDVKEVKTKKNIKTFEGHKDSVTCIQCNFHGSKFASSSLDKTIMLWDMHTGKLISTLEGHKGGVNSIFFTDHTIVSASADSTVKIYDTRIEKCTRTLMGHVADVTCLQFDVDTNTLLSGSIDKTIREWDISSGVCTNILKSNESINCLYFDQNKIICGSHDKTLKIWNRHQEKASPTILKGHSDIILSLAFSKCIIGNQPVEVLASAGRDKKPLLWLPQQNSKK